MDAPAPDPFWGPGSARRSSMCSLFPSIVAPWRADGPSLLVRWDERAIPPGDGTVSVFAADLNDTLVGSKRGRPGYAVTVDDWMPWNGQVIPRLRELHAEGFLIAIHTNQGNVKSALSGKRAGLVREYIDSFLTELGVPVLVFMATMKDQYRKPGIQMWEHMESALAGLGHPVNRGTSVYVGDAAGGPGEHSAADSEYAAALGVRFVHARDEFAPPPPPPSGEPAAAEAPAAGSEEPSDPPTVLVLVGLPGAGKSTFAGSLLAGDGTAWKRVCQDELGSRQRCEALAAEHLRNGRPVVIDRTNANAEQRAPWVALAKQHGATAEALVFGNVSASVCCDRVVAREGHEGRVEGVKGKRAVMMTAARWAEVGPAEGFARVVHAGCDTALAEELERQRARFTALADD